jgi:hypothetical protein
MAMSGGGIGAASGTSSTALIYDNYNDGAIDTTLWTNAASETADSYISSKVDMSVMSCKKYFKFVSCSFSWLGIAATQGEFGYIDFSNVFHALSIQLTSGSFAVENHCSIAYDRGNNLIYYHTINANTSAQTEYQGSVALNASVFKAFAWRANNQPFNVRWVTYT